MPHKLLLADDSVTIQRVIELTFADEDVQVSVVSDGKQAIDVLKRDRPDIVLADIGMPERDGYEVAEFIKNDPNLAHIPVILLTGAFEPLDENRARTVGCDGVLMKPFEPQMVINRVRELLSGHRPAAAGRTNIQPEARVSDDFDARLAPPASSSVASKQEGTESLDDYFDRLDAAFANLGAPAPAPAPAAAPAQGRAEIEPEDLSAGIAELDEPPPQRAPVAADPLRTWDPELVSDFGPARQPALANAFAALLAAEEGDTTADFAPMLAAPAALGDDAIEDIVQRVLTRMSDDTMRRAVLETAERLVREEIDRIKRAAKASTDQRSGG
jgi:CheY-like chemotaxis protein